MPARKNTQRHLPAAKAHLNELLDEALKQTFPASDPIAINVEVQSPEAARAARAPQKQAQDAVHVGGMKGPADVHLAAALAEEHELTKRADPQGRNIAAREKVTRQRPEFEMRSIKRAG